MRYSEDKLQHFPRKISWGTIRLEIKKNTGSDFYVDILLHHLPFFPPRTMSEGIGWHIKSPSSPALFILSFKVMQYFLTNEILKPVSKYLRLD